MLQTTDGRATAYSEREREFTFAKNRWKPGDVSHVVHLVSSVNIRQDCLSADIKRRTAALMLPSSNLADIAWLSVADLLNCLTLETAEILSTLLAA